MDSHFLKRKKVGHKVLSAKRSPSCSTALSFHIIYCLKTEPRALWQEGSDIIEAGIHPMIPFQYCAQQIHIPFTAFSLAV